MVLIAWRRYYQLAHANPIKQSVLLYTMRRNVQRGNSVGSEGEGEGECSRAENKARLDRDLQPIVRIRQR